MKTKRVMNFKPACGATSSQPSPGLRVAMSVLIALALAVGFATARAQPAEGTPAMSDGWNGFENQPYRVNIWHDRGDDEIYQRGEAVRIHFEANSDAYAVVYRIDAEGLVSILWPRSRYDDGFVFGNHTYNLPTPGAERIRTAGTEGVEYVQVLVSAYPFDLRNLEVDFHHESGQEEQGYYVAGDPFLAMNDVNYAVTGLEDPSDYVVTNYLSYYVHRKVDYPRYMCTQCHDDSSYQPYSDTCLIEIHHDYSWDNDWYGRYQYYPAYYYPVYYYVDPWTWRPWINYWYRPWYAWPTWGYSVWDFDCYVWNYSPYWRGDVWVRYKEGRQRYRPIVKNHRYADNQGERDYEHPGAIVKTPRPTKDMVASMNRKEAIRKQELGRSDQRVDARREFKDTGRAVKPVAGFTKQPRDERAPGIRMPSGVGRNSTDGPAVRPNPATGRDGREDARPVRPDASEGQQPIRVSPGTRTAPQVNDVRAVRPVKPHTQGSRIWQGGSRDQKPARTVKPRPGNDEPTRKAPEAKPRSDGDKTPTRKPQTAKPEGGNTPNERSPSSVKPKSNSGSKSDGSTRSQGSGSSSSPRGKGGGRSSSNRGAKR
ncbi:DUF4384 domain-containing protein [bacterium]|nr:DUF4384 domain-containing protein [bacterium]MBU1073489.1 DUF4384 domain-containing protein [bacterium]MBU1674201.1 DUF4384 domain-containing protein [bacterium]